MLLLSIWYYHVRAALGGGSASSLHSFIPHVSGATVSSWGWAERVFNRTLPSPDASLLDAIYEGSSSVLSLGMRHSMEAAGTSYIVGMYGYKIHLLFHAVRDGALRIISRPYAILAGLVAIAVFVFAAHGRQTALRAGIMMGGASSAELLGRKFNPYRGLLFTAALMLFINPSLWNSAGFLLSLMSLLGIYGLVPFFRSIFDHIFDRAPRHRSQGNNATTDVSRGEGIFSWRFHLAAACAVNAAIFPIVAATYGSFPFISFISNFFAALPFGVIVALSALYAIMAHVVSAASFLFVPALVVLLSYERFVSAAFSVFPFLISGKAISWLWCVIYYFVLGIGVALWHGHTNRKIDKGYA